LVLPTIISLSFLTKMIMAKQLTDYNSYQALSVEVENRRETACSVILLTKDRAIKFKKNVNFGFLDYSSRDKRLWALKRELAFNQVHAPDVYLSVCEDVDEPYLVMRRFLETDLLAEALKADSPPEPYEFDRLGQILAQKHAQSESHFDDLHKDNIGYVVQSNHEQFLALSQYDHWDLNTSLIVSEATRKIHKGLEAFLHQRHRNGLVRACHGDLHLGNIVFENGNFILFDCIEFNDHLRLIDPIYDLAFVLMDLIFNHHSHLANRLFNAYIEESLRLETCQGGSYPCLDGLKILPLALSVRASVRAHVSGHNETDASLAKSYLDLAYRFLTPSKTKLIAVGGLSGSGKTTFARFLGGKLDQGAGPIILRSDVQRKRLFGVSPSEALPPEAYGEEASQNLLKALGDLARQALLSGQDVIIDASFRQPKWRNLFEDLARQLNLEFEAFWLETDLSIRNERIENRSALKGKMRDASDADLIISSSQVKEGALSPAWKIIHDY
jgi:aminoglycoside phosphotransferase family enzyme/predicted kinase